MTESTARSTDSASSTDTVPVVFIHGVGDTGKTWAGIISHLQELGLNREFVTYDLRGHGESEKYPLVDNVGDFVADLVTLLDSRGIERADIVGFSLGGLVAQSIAIEHPDRVRRLITIGSVAGRTAEESERALKRWSEIKEEGPLGVAERSVERWYTPEYLDAHPETRTATLERFAALDPEAYAAAYGVLATTDLAAHLETISAPTLAIAAEWDVGSPPHMSALIAEKTRGRLVVLNGVKHGGILREFAAATAKEIHDHVK